MTTRNLTQWHYNALDCMITFELWQELEHELSKLPSNVRATYDFALCKRYAFLEMQLRGLRINTSWMEEALTLLQRDIDLNFSVLDKLCEGTIGCRINPNSPKQVAILLFDYLKCSGPPTTGEDNIRVLAAKDPICAPFVAFILRLRNLLKQKSFLQKPMDKEPDGSLRFRYQFNIAGTVTGRASSRASLTGTGSNAQNIDRRLRRLFISDPGYILVNIDLEQADSRNVGARLWNNFIFTHGEDFAGAYLDACESGDLHTSVAKMVWPGVEDVHKMFIGQDSFRQTAKKIGHAANYAGTPKTISLRTGTPLSAVASFQQDYFEAFPAIPLWHQWVKDTLKEESVLTTLWGRRRRFLNRPNVKSVINEAIAYDPQSSTAEEIDRGLFAVWMKFPFVQLLAQVHDSILFQIPEDKLSELPSIASVMPQTLLLEADREFTVPCELKYGQNFADRTEDNPDGLRAWTG